MPNRIEVGLNKDLFDAQGHIDSQRVKNALGLDVDIEYVKVYTEDLGLTPKEVSRFAEELRHPLVNTASVNTSENAWNLPYNTYVIETGYKPGVMDPEGRSSKLLAETVFKRQIPFDRKVAVQHQRRIKSRQPLTDTQLKKIASLFYNTTVQNYRVLSAEDLSKGIEPYMPEVRLPPPEPVKYYDLDEKINFVKYLARQVVSGGRKGLTEGIKRSKSWRNSIAQAYGKRISLSDYLFNKDFRRAANWLRISEDRSLALDVREMHAIYEHQRDPDFLEARKKGGLAGKITDAELELDAQTWSEHCKHKIFNASVKYTEGDRTEILNDGIFTEFIKKPTLELQRKKPGLIKSVLWDNSGVVDFDPDGKYYICFKCETHNSPSFIEPYGGAITGIVGVIRDPLGTGRGSLIIFGVWGYCTGSPFYDGDLRPPLHPDQSLDGIHRGNRDGGNKHGVTNAGGGTFFDDSYLGKCLVYVGAAGAVPKTVAGRPGYEKWINPGDKCIVVGGRVGKDGIHGATGSSQEFSEHTPAGHVQIGDPYTQKNVQELTIEALNEGIINFAQDSGAGGTGSAAGEMAGMVKYLEEIEYERYVADAYDGKETQGHLNSPSISIKDSVRVRPAKCKGGAIIDLSKDLFKYEGLADWEKLESESQERMFFAVSPNNVKRFGELAGKWGVEWREIGEFNDTGYFDVVDGDKQVAYIDLNFLHKGTPKKNLNAIWKTPEERGLAEPGAAFYEKVMQQNPTDILNSILKRENIASKEFLQREYDTRVQGKTVVPAFVGEKSDVPSDAFVQLIEYERDTGVACGIGLNPSYSKIDTYDMTMMAANEGLMRVVAVGADPDSAVNNGNYCWPGVLPDESDESEYKMAQLVRAAKAQRDFALATEVATISGKDSMKIQGNIETADGGRRRVYGLPAIQFATIAPVPDVKKSVTSDFKSPGDVIYVVGSKTKDELGGSEFYQMFGETGINVPKVNPNESIDVCRRLHSAMKNEYVESAKICSKGGLAAALSYSSIGGGLGASIDLSGIGREFDDGEKTSTKLLYSETASRFVVSVRPEYAREFETTMGCYAQRIGHVTDTGINIRGVDGKPMIETNYSALKASWQSTFAHKNYHGDEASRQNQKL